jgi:uncharacterized OB-fold protein
VSDSLMVFRCQACGHMVWPPRLLCPRCGSAESEAIPAGPGVVAEQVQTTSPGGEPVTIASVRLHSGPTVIARGYGTAIGDEVRLCVRDGALSAEPGT